jgi:hypothetical protein
VIIEGKSRGRAPQLGRYLESVGKNERALLIEVRGTIAEDAKGAILEMEAFALGTRCELPLYHAMINPEPGYPLTPTQRIEAVDALEAKLGLNGHARVVVLHEKGDRAHMHVVWSRIDLTSMHAVSDSHNYRRHEEVARELELRFGHAPVKGKLNEQDRPKDSLSRAEKQQQERTGISGRKVRKQVTEAFQASDGPDAFRASLEQRGFIVARGDRRDYVIIDYRGGVHSLARRVEGIRAAELRAFMAPLDHASFPNVSDARAEALEKDRLRQAKREARQDDRIEKAYLGGADYVHQTEAALKDIGLHRRREKKKRDEDRRQQAMDQQRSDDGRKQQESLSSKRPSIADNVEMTSSNRARLERLKDSEGDDNSVSREDWAPDHQPTVPGGGRTRDR